VPGPTADGLAQFGGSAEGVRVRLVVGAFGLDVRADGAVRVVIGDLLLLAVCGDGADPFGPRRALLGVRGLVAEPARPGGPVSNGTFGQRFDPCVDQVCGGAEVRVVVAGE